MAGHGTVEEIEVIENMPIALLVKFSTRGGERGTEKGAEFLVAMDAKLSEADREVDIFYGDEIRIEPSDGFAGITSGPESSEGDFVLRKVECEDGPGGDDPW